MDKMSSYNVLIVEDENDIAIALEAYLTNQGYNVFIANNGIEGLEVLKKEVVAFISCRLATGILDIVIMYICVDVMQWNALLMKIASNVLVIILNYIFSKLVIFKKK